MISVPPPPRITRQDIDSALQRDHMRRRAMLGDLAAVAYVLGAWPADLPAVLSGLRDTGKDDRP